MVALVAGVVVIQLPDVSPSLDAATRGIAEWLVLLGLVGLGRSFLHRPIRWVGRLNAISLPFYIWHQTVILLIAYFVIQWEATVPVKFLAIALPALVVSWGLSEAVRLTRPTRLLFGLREPSG
jgi:peptidoglycan/LPS O-acetylase OafA/YrhL